jgi:hypothetical protein
MQAGAVSQDFVAKALAGPREIAGKRKATEGTAL